MAPVVNHILFTIPNSIITVAKITQQISMVFYALMYMRDINKSTHRCGHVAVSYTEEIPEGVEGIRPGTLVHSAELRVQHDADRRGFHITQHGRM